MCSTDWLHRTGTPLPSRLPASWLPPHFCGYIVKVSGVMTGKSHVLSVLLVVYVRQRGISLCLITFGTPYWSKK